MPQPSIIPTNVEQRRLEKAAASKGLGIILKALQKGTKVLTRTPLDEAIISSKKDLLTKPLVTVLAPNYGKWSNRALLAGGLGTGGYAGYKSFKEVEEMRKQIKDTIALQEAFGKEVPKDLKDLTSYPGLFKSYVKGSPVYHILNKEIDPSDKAVFEASNIAAGKALKNLAKSPLSVFEYFSPVVAGAKRWISDAIGEKMSTENLSNKIREVIKLKGLTRPEEK